mmetsp:Transcript_4379/g.11498  ORF Transcript_4379/g.11498 Transcript_4379/m.11498 type:complete len:334 (+) Transcript_4379:210-1211(+)
MVVDHGSTRRIVCTGEEQNTVHSYEHFGAYSCLRRAGRTLSLLFVGHHARRPFYEKVRMVILHDPSSSNSSFIGLSHNLQLIICSVVEDDGLQVEGGCSGMWNHVTIGRDHVVGGEVPTDMKWPGHSLQVFVHERCVRSVDIDLLHHHEIHPVRIRHETMDLFVGARLLFSKLVAREGQQSHLPRRILQRLQMLIPELHHFLVVPVGEPALRCHVYHHRHVPAELLEIHLHAVDVVCGQVEERIDLGKDLLVLRSVFLHLFVRILVQMQPAARCGTVVPHPFEVFFALARIGPASAAVIGIRLGGIPSSCQHRNAQQGSKQRSLRQIHGGCWS